MSIKSELFTSHNDIVNTIKNHPLMKQIDELVSIDTAVVGGAVRDMILDKPIKDIDIVLSFNFLHNSKMDDYNSKAGYQSYKNDYDYDIKRDSFIADALLDKEKKIFTIFGKEDFKFLHEELLKENTNIFNLTSLLIQHILNQDSSYAITRVFQQQNNSDQKEKLIALKEHAYNNIGLVGVISLSDKKSKYPIELLLTADSISSFVQSFDFGFCKTYMLNNNNNPEIVRTDEFNQDINNKTITYTPCMDVTENQVRKSLLTRYLRLQEKFSEYNLCLETKNISNSPLLETIKTYVKSIVTYKKLNRDSNEIPVQENRVKSNKI